MDKYEYKVRSEEIKALIAEENYVQAADIADTIDWRRVKSVLMLCTISDLYKINRRYEDAKNMLLLAYERRPGGRTICYSLCELCIKTEEFVQALRYYKEFVQASPKDASRFVLQYKLYEAQEVSLEERIGVLEELKKRDYREKWAYELAFLYHRVGLATRCVEECDEMILWFGEGRYVVKAMELKMLHQPLTPAQQDMYDHRFIKYEEETQAGDGGQEEYMPEEPPQAAAPQPELVQDSTDSGSQAQTVQPEEIDIQVKTVDVGKYNTINLQAELAAGLQEVLGADDITRSIVAPMMETDTDIRSSEEQESFVETEQDAEGVEETEVFFGETGEMSGTTENPQADMEKTDFVQADAGQEQDSETQKRQSSSEAGEQDGRAAVPPYAVQPPKELADVLSQEANGQISLVLPDAVAVEKQLTGQMKIEDVLAEWAKMKKEREEHYREEVRQRVLKETGPMFTEFEAAVRDGLLEQLENGTAPEDLGAELPAGNVPEEEAAAYESTAPEPETGEADDLQETAETADEVSEDPAAFEAEQEELSAEEEYPGDESAGCEEPDGAEYTGNEDEESDGEPDGAEYIEEEQTEESAELEYIEDAFEEQEYSGEDEAEEASQETLAEAGSQKENQEGGVPEGEHTGKNTKAEEDSKPEGEPEQNDNDKEEEDEPVRYETAKVRGLTREEKELYAPFIQSRSSREQLVKAIDNISMAAYTGNIVITGEEGMDTLALAKNMIREVRLTDSNFSGKVAKVTGQGLNDRNVAETLERMNNGALIIQKASGMNTATADKLHKLLQQERLGIIVVLEDTKKAVNRLLSNNPKLAENFTARMDLEALSNDTLVSFGRLYAREMEYSIDDLGVLALHTRIEELQTIDHVVTVIEVKQIVDEAISRASRKTIGHFFDILFAKRYDNEDMVILTEKDFVA